MLGLSNIGWTSERGDTLIEVTFALAIMSAVLIGATAVAAQAFRLSLTARERTQLVNAAIEQAEGLRSFRDNHSWGEFLNGNAPGPGHFLGVLNVGTSNCSLPSLSGKQCFSMQLANNEWEPSSALANTTNNTVPPQTSIEIYQPATASDTNCVVKYEVHYGSPSASAQHWQEGFITVELVNAKFVGPYAGRCTP